MKHMKTWDELMQDKEAHGALMEEIFSLTDDGLLIANGEGVCIKINPAFSHISGLSEEMLIGVSHKHMAETGIVTNSCVLKVLEKQKKTTVICEYPATGRKALVTGTPLINDAGELELVVISARDVTELKETEEKLKKEQELVKKYERQIESLQEQARFGENIVAADKQMIRVIQLANRMVNVTTNLLITGESGSGKEEVAKYIHNAGTRKQEPFIAINCGAIPESLIESELFGYMPGTFTGALKEGKMGLIEAADKGTLFLDEIGELPLAMQVKLLRFLQTKEIIRVGSKKSVFVDARVIAASHRNLESMVRDGSFREDLFYRLNVVPINVPPLRERREDIIPLAKQFILQFNEQYGLNKRFSESAFQELYEYNWPGNVRELRNLIERLMVIHEEDLIATVFSQPTQVSILNELQDGTFSLKERIEQIEYGYLKEAYHTYGSVRKAAEHLQMTRSTFNRKLEQYEKNISSRK